MPSVLWPWKSRGELREGSVQSNIHQVYEPTRPELDGEKEEG